MPRYTLIEVVAPASKTYYNALLYIFSLRKVLIEYILNFPHSKTIIEIELCHLNSSSSL